MKQPKYKIIQDYIIDSIENGLFLPGQPIPSESDLCNIFNVSRIVVRRATDELVIKSILYRKQGKGTFISGQETVDFNVGKAIRIGIVVPYINTSTRRILLTIEQELANNGLLPIIAQTYGDQEIEEAKIINLTKNGVRGLIIYTSTCAEERKKLSAYINAHMPIVFIDRYIEDWPFDVVVGKDEEAGFQAVEHLHLKHNARKIGFLGADPYPMKSVRDRLAGLRKALRSFELPEYENAVELIFNAQSRGDVGEETHGVRDFIRNYLQRNKDLDAVVTTNDLVAANLYRVCREMDIEISKDLKVISFTNDLYADLVFPPLTSFDQNLDMLGQRASQILIDRISEKRKGPPVKEEIEYKLLIRNSCGCGTHQ